MFFAANYVMVKCMAQEPNSKVHAQAPYLAYR